MVVEVRIVRWLRLALVIQRDNGPTRVKDNARARQPEAIGHALYRVYSSPFLPLPAAFFLAAVLARLTSSASSTLGSITVTLPPAFSTAALAEAVA